jgi:impB/mucB/samB family C-terminal domain
MIEGLCKEVEKRMNNIGVKGVKVTLKLKQRKVGAPPPPKYLGHGSCHNLSKCAEVRDKKPTRVWKCFFDVAVELYHELKVAKEDVRGMGVVVSKLVQDSSVESIDSSPKKRSITKWFNEFATKSDADKSTRKVDFIVPTKTLDEEVEEIDEDSTSSDILWVESEATCEQTTGIDNDNHEIVLPALSQIHMSQVNLLPSPLRKQIINKMENETMKLPPAPGNRPNFVRENLRFRQTNVKRMFRLASIKSGAETLLNESGQVISLTQLECLPLELQLDVVNDDSNGLGPISPEKKRRKVSTAIGSRLDPTSIETVRQEKVKSSPTNRDTDVPQKKVYLHDSDITDNKDVMDHIEVIEAPDFVRDNVVPFMSYMDKHPNISNEAIQHIIEFLRICISEHRLMDTVLLLQCMNHRSDHWSDTIVLESILNQVNEQVQKCYRASLDKEWILQL